MDMNLIIKISLFIDDAYTLSKLIKSSRCMLHIYQVASIWKRLILKTFPLISFLYQDIPLSEINWYTELKLLFIISNYPNESHLNYFTRETPFYNIENKTMTDILSRYTNSITNIWEYSPLSVSAHDADSGDSIFLYNIKRFSWDLRNSTAPRAWNKSLNSLKDNKINDFYIRSYIVIPSSLLFYRLLLLFGYPEITPLIHSDIIWKFSLVHVQTNSIVTFHDNMGGMRFMFNKGNKENHNFINDIINLLNLITFPLFVHSHSKILDHKFLIRNHLAKIHDCYLNYFLYKINDNFDLNQSQKHVDQYNKKKNKMDDIFNGTSSYYVVTCDTFCNSNNTSIDSHNLLNLTQSENNVPVWNVTDRRDSILDSYIFFGKDSNWYAYAKSGSDNHNFFLNLCTNNIVQLLPEFFIKEIMPSSLALYRLICLFPSTFYKLYYYGSIWKIVLSHSHTAKLIEISDKNGTFNISIFNETIPTLNEFDILTEINVTDSEANHIFHQDVVNLLNKLISNNVILPNGIIAGYVA